MRRDCNERVLRISPAAEDSTLALRASGYCIRWVGESSRGGNDWVSATSTVLLAGGAGCESVRSLTGRTDNRILIALVRIGRERRRDIRRLAVLASREVRWFEASRRIDGNKRLARETKPPRWATVCHQRRGNVYRARRVVPAESLGVFARWCVQNRKSAIDPLVASPLRIDVGIKAWVDRGNRRVA